MTLPQLQAALQAGFFATKESRKSGVLDLRPFKADTAPLVLYRALFELAELKGFPDAERLQQRQSNGLTPQEDAAIERKMTGLIERISQRGLLLVVGTPFKTPQGAIVFTGACFSVTIVYSR